MDKINKISTKKIIISNRCDQLYEVNTAPVTVGQRAIDQHIPIRPTLRMYDDDDDVLVSRLHAQNMHNAPFSAQNLNAPFNAHWCT